MKTIEELSPKWVGIVDDKGTIPYMDSDTPDILINKKKANIADPKCCFVGEARGGECYFYGFLTESGNLISDRLDDCGIENKTNPDYCDKCYNISMEFHDNTGLLFEESVYKDICKRFEKHYNEAHNGDRCKE